MSDCFVLYLLLICMKKKKSGAGKFTNNTELLQALRHTGIYLEDNRSYRIYGALNPKECLASFSMNECVLVDDMTRTEESV